MLGSDSGQDNMAQGAVMGVLPEARETAHQQTVDPGDKKTAADGKQPATVPHTVLDPGGDLPEAVGAGHVPGLFVKPLIWVLDQFIQNTGCPKKNVPMFERP